MFDETGYRLDRIPGAERAYAEEAKFIEYLLNPESPDGAAKAALFRRLGFDRTNWEGLRDQMVAALPFAAGAFQFRNAGGWEQWTAVIRIVGPLGQADHLTVWEVRPEGARLVTAYAA